MNNQQITKIISYFRINHNFHSPYTFLVDGNFLKILIEKGMDLQEKLKSIIPGKLKVKITTCTVTQLQMLGRQFSIMHQKAQQIQGLKCTHTFQPVDRCILQHAAKEESLIVCTQDKILRRKLRNKGVGIMHFGPDQRITMEDIERHQFQKDRYAERSKFQPMQNEKEKIEQFKQQQQVIQKLKNRSEQNKIASLRGQQLKFIKKKVVKGPNPLSVKKKQHTDPQFEKVKNGSEEQTVVQKTKRIRKRKNKNNQNDGNTE